jgi:hypothetical protein
MATSTIPLTKAQMMKLYGPGSKNEEFEALENHGAT